MSYWVFQETLQYGVGANPITMPRDLLSAGFTNGMIDTGAKGSLDPIPPGTTLYKKSLRVLVDGQEVAADPQNGYLYDERTHSIRFQGAAKKKAFAAKIDITYEEHK